MSSERDDDPYDDEPIPGIYDLGRPPSEYERRLDAINAERAARRAARLEREKLERKERRARKKKKRRERRARKDRKRELGIEKLERELAERGGGEFYEPFDFRELEEAVRLLANGATYRDVIAATGLSNRRIFYVKEALKHGDVWPKKSGRLGLSGACRNTRRGVFLPKRVS